LRLFYGCDDEETPDACDGIGLAEALLDLDGFKVLDVVETATGELTITMETNDRGGGLSRLWGSG